jgi:Ca2+/H+ antiporter, TMEM165/GDT1 family
MPKRTKCFLLVSMMSRGVDLRSQIATLSLAAHRDPYGITAGAFAGHAVCTGAAVVGGQLLARRISPRTVALLGGGLFLVFAALNVFSTD